MRHICQRTGWMTALAVIGFLGTTGSAGAVPTLELSSGSNTVTVADGDSDDFNNTDGAVTFVGAVGVFDINVSTGITKPANGSAALPDIDLNSVNTSNSSGELTIKFSETDFSGTGETTLFSDVGGTAEGSTEFQVEVDSSNSLFGSGTTIADLGPFSGGGFSGATKDTFNITGPYSITQTATITHFSDGGTTSFDIQTNVPAPATLGLVGAGLIGLGVLSRRRKTDA